MKQPQEKRRSTEIQSDEMRRAIKDQFGEMQEKRTASSMQDHYMFQLLHEHIKNTECHTEGILSSLEFVSFQNGVLHIRALDNVTRSILIMFRRPMEWALDLRQCGIRIINLLPCNNHNNHTFQLLQEYIQNTEYDAEDTLSSLEFASFQDGTLTIKVRTRAMHTILVAYNKPQKWALDLRQYGIQEIRLVAGYPIIYRANNHNKHIFQLLKEHIRATESDIEDMLSSLEFVSFQNGVLLIRGLNSTMRLAMQVYGILKKWELALKQHGVREIIIQ